MAEDVLRDPYVLRRRHMWKLVDVDKIAHILGFTPEERWRRVLLECARDNQRSGGNTIMPTTDLLDAGRKAQYSPISQTISVDAREGVFGDLMEGVGGGEVMRMQWGKEYALVESMREECSVFALASSPPCLRNACDDAQQVLDATYTRKELSAEQKRAVIQSFGPHRMALVTGNPGCGKSACCDAIAHVARELGWRHHFMAYTWLAAQRIGQACEGVKATSIHKYIYTRMRQDDHSHWDISREESRDWGELDISVVDEASLVDSSILAKLLKVLPARCRLILVGDDAQLPPIGYGQPFADLVAACRSNNPRVTAPLSKLTHVFRTDKPHIIGFGDACRTGRMPQWITQAGGHVSSPDFEWHGTSDVKCFLEELKKLLRHARSTGGTADIQILAAGKKSIIGMPALNALAARMLRPAAGGAANPDQFRCNDLVMRIRGNEQAVKKDAAAGAAGQGCSFNVPISARGRVHQEVGLKGRTTKVVRWLGGECTPLNKDTAKYVAPAFVAGDKVMFWTTARNNPEVRNGHRGTVASVTDAGEVLVDYGELGLVYHDRDELDDLQLAYAITVHKYQGNEVPHAFVVVHGKHGRPLLTRNMLYTAVTRGKSKVTLCCDIECMKECMRTPSMRKTCLQKLLTADLKPLIAEYSSALYSSA